MKSQLHIEQNVQECDATMLTFIHLLGAKESTCLKEHIKENKPARYIKARFLSKLYKQKLRMKTRTVFAFSILILFTGISLQGLSQNVDGKPAQTKTVAAGKEYKRSALHHKLWGKNYRKEWAEPVQVRVLNLETTMGGLKPVKAGGGHQSKSLHLQSKDGKMYTIRTVNKTLSKVLPESFHHTFIEDMANDLVSMSHPYSALAVPYMAEKVGIYHTNPEFVYVPEQPALDSFNKEYGNKYYLFEQRASGNWSNSNNMGKFEDYEDTDDILEDILEDNDEQVDQKTFAKSRLFDMFIGDWDRHEDQWKWGTVTKGKSKTFVPVPSDRDQAFSRHNGLLLNLAFGASGIKYMQPFGSSLKDVNNFNFEQRGIDRIFTNELTHEDWLGIAKTMQQSLTDEVIERSIKQMPAEVFATSGKEMISHLKSRRDHLTDYADEYYRFLAKEVEITGSKKNERFEIDKLNDNETTVRILKITKSGEEKEPPFYERTFKADETKEIRLFGLSGNDVYAINGVDNGMKVRLIGGIDKDSIIDESANRIANRFHIYDNPGNVFASNGANKTASFGRLHISSDTSINAYKYKSFIYNKKGLGPTAGFTYLDRIFVGLAYTDIRHKWRREPFSSKQRFGVNYSLSQTAWSATYDGLFPHTFGKTDLVLKGYYDAVVWTHFFGLGNETVAPIKEINHYRLRTVEAFGSVGLHRGWDKNNLTLSAAFNSVKIKNDADRFAVKNFTTASNSFDTKNFGSAQLAYSVHQLNDSVLPTKGVVFSASAGYTQNLKESNRSFTKYGGSVQFYIPLASKLSLAVRAGGATVAGTPEFYQNVSIGGPDNLRGYRRDRFWGKSAFFNTNELQFVSKVRTYLFSGKAGLLFFYDDGRVWMPGEKSEKWHTSYGPGLIVAPFSAIAAVLTYGITPETNIVHLRINKFF